MQRAVLALCVAALVLGASAADDPSKAAASESDSHATASAATGTAGSTSMAKPLRILPLGDGVTLGVSGGCSPPGELAPPPLQPDSTQSQSQSDAQAAAESVEKQAEALAAAAASAGSGLTAAVPDTTSSAAAKSTADAQAAATAAAAAPKAQEAVTAAAAADKSCLGGYRAYLWRALNAGTNRDNRRAAFVGTQSNGPVDIDAAHEGREANTITATANSVPDVFAAVTPFGKVDAVLLHVGTNDATGQAMTSDDAHAATPVTELKRLLTAIATASPETVVFLAAIIPIFGSDTARTDAVNALNTEIVKLTKAAPQPGVVMPRLVLVDMRSAATQWGAVDMATAVYPNPYGYAKMSRAWATALRGEFKALDVSLTEWDKIAAVSTTETRESAPDANTKARSRTEVHATDADAEFDWHQTSVVLLLTLSVVAFAVGITIGAYTMVCARTPGLSANSNGFEV